MSDYLSTEQTNLVFGYIRRVEKKFKWFIPNGLKLQMVLFFFGKDYFDDGHNTGCMILTHNDQQIITMKQHELFRINTAYGAFAVNPDISKIHIWKFKIISCYGYIYIGIDNAAKIWKNDWFAGRQNEWINGKMIETNNYSYCCNGNKYSHNTGGMGKKFCQGFYVGSVILMELDLSSKIGELSFGILKYGNDWQNDALFSTKLAFRNISRKHKYRLAVQMRSKSTVQLLSYRSED